MWRGLFEEFRDRLPVNDSTPVITLHEGNTPLVPAPAASLTTGAWTSGVEPSLSETTGSPSANGSRSR